MRGIRSRLALSLVALVAVTVMAIGVGTYAFVDARLRAGLLDEAARQAQFNLSVLVPERLPDGDHPRRLRQAGLAAAFRLRGDVGTIVDFHDGGTPWVSDGALLGAIGSFPPELRPVVDAGQLGYAGRTWSAQPSLVVAGPAGRPAGTAVLFSFVFPATSDPGGARAAPARPDRGRPRRRRAGAGRVAPRRSRDPPPGRFGERGGRRDRRRRPLGTRPRGRRRRVRAIRRRVQSHGRLARRDGRRGCRRRRPRTGGSSPTSRTSCERRSPRSWPRRRVIEAGPGCRPTPVVRPSCSSPTCAACGRSSRTSWSCPASTPARSRPTSGRSTSARRPGRSSRRGFRAPRSTGPRARIVVQADVRRLDRIIGNLLDNASQHAPGGAVEVRWRATAATRP